MSTIESIKKDINASGYADKEEKLNYLEVLFCLNFKTIHKQSLKKGHQRNLVSFSWVYSTLFYKLTRLHYIRPQHHFFRLLDMRI